MSKLKTTPVQQQFLSMLSILVVLLNAASLPAQSIQNTAVPQQTDDPALLAWHIFDNDTEEAFINVNRHLRSHCWPFTLTLTHSFYMDLRRQSRSSGPACDFDKSQNYYQIYVNYCLLRPIQQMIFAGGIGDA